MLGIIFTEFLELVEDRFGLEMSDRIIRESGVPNNGSYTAVGNYPYSEMEALVDRLHIASGISVPDLLKLYGEHLFGRLAIQYPDMISTTKNSFDLLSQVDRHIHVLVKKLYPAAELPRFNCSMLSDERMELMYSSKRQMADLAEGLMLGCAKHFSEAITITRENDDDHPDNVRFLIQRK